MSNNKAVEVSDEEFQGQVLDAEVPVVVDFWAEWCAPCRQLSKTLEGVIAGHENVRFVKVNVDHNPVTPSKYGVRSIPTLIAFSKGVPVGQLVGAVSGDAINKLVQQASGT